ncbi:hypothetical protein C2845_PM07G20330 [Panicum miliaceum]|uniref:Protein PLASTID TRANSCRIPTIONALLY ACTIVE 7 n=1 Tax=Panicum miliaceum TaxID=4540 RepID=A0A3L6SQT6_PANMI|nr:hypothetical protein C2845_PM07G20330 [Panicum miliaceum]
MIPARLPTQENSRVLTTFGPTDPFRLTVCQPTPTAREPDEVRDPHRLGDPCCKMAMAMASFAVASHHRSGHLAAGLPSSAREGWRVGRRGVTISMRAQKKKSSGDPGSSSGGGGAGGDGRASSSGRRVWRRRKLTKEDDMLRYKLDRIPFLEEKVRKVRENGKIICLDINQLMLSQENRFAFTMEVAEEANAYLEKNRHEYGLKKPILHVISDRMNEAGFSRPEGYLYPYPIKPGPYFIKEEGH